jgi:threonine synthase
MFKSIELCGRCHGATVLVKDESRNPFGTFKDRRCAALLDLHKDKQELVFVHITSGNSGYSLGMMAKEEERKTGRRISVVNLVPKDLPEGMKKKLATCSFVHEIDITKGIITFEEMRKIARSLTGYKGDDKNIVGVEDYGLANGYRAIIREIDADGVKPSHIFCPVGEGELLTELASEAEAVWGKDAPRIVGITIPDNVLVKEENFLKRIRRSAADKLRNGYSKFKELINNLVKRGMVELKTVTEGEIASEYRYLGTIGISAEPSAAVAFRGASNYPLDKQDTVVVINTGKGVYDQNAVERVWARRAVRALKALGLMVAGVAVALGLKFGYEEMRDYMHKHEQTERELKSEQLTNKTLWEQERVNSAIRVASEVPPIQAACMFLGKPKELCDFYLYESDFTKFEIYYLYRLSNLGHDNILRERKMELMESWQKGRFQPDEDFYRYYPECMKSGAAPVPDNCFGPITPLILRSTGLHQ